jgi:hypothetical protein
MSGLLHLPGHFTPEERAAGTYWIGGWVDPRTDLDDMDRRRFLLLLGFKLRPFDPPVYSQSLYRLSHLFPKYHAEKETEVVGCMCSKDVSGLRIRGAILLFPQYVFIASAWSVQFAQGLRPLSFFFSY